VRALLLVLAACGKGAPDALADAGAAVSPATVEPDVEFATLDELRQLTSGIVMQDLSIWREQSGKCVRIFLIQSVRRKVEFAQDGADITIRLRSDPAASPVLRVGRWQFEAAERGGRFETIAFREGTLHLARSPSWIATDLYLTPY
jgi:hypothetical protein